MLVNDNRVDQREKKKKDKKNRDQRGTPCVSMMSLENLVSTLRSRSINELIQGETW